MSHTMGGLFLCFFKLMMKFSLGEQYTTVDKYSIAGHFDSNNSFATTAYFL